MAWRPMRSLAETPSSQTTGLRGQVNAIAPGRSKASDGLVGDEVHETTSGHYPHYVSGVGSEIVTAWDCTNDPTNGCDSWLLAETLRQHRDKRIRYVISNKKIFSSYASGSRAAWTWGTYSGSNPHTGHCHIQTLDDKISDTTTPWNLEGFDMTISEEDLKNIAAHVWNTFRTSNPDATAWQVLVTGKLTRDNALYWWLKALANGTVPTTVPGSGFDWTKMIEAPFPGLIQLGEQLDALKATVDQIVSDELTPEQIEMIATAVANKIAPDMIDSVKQALREGTGPTI